MKKIILWLLMFISIMPLSFASYYENYDIKDFWSKDWYSYYKNYWIKDKAPISSDEQKRRLDIANYYAEFFMKNYKLLENKYIRPEYSAWILYFNYNAKNQNSNPQFNFSENYDYKRNWLSSAEIDFFTPLNTKIDSLVPLLFYYNSLDYYFISYFNEQSLMYINWVFDYQIKNGQLDWYNADRSAYTSPKDPLAAYLQNVHHHIKSNLTTTKSQCEKSDLYIKNSINWTIEQQWVSLDYFVRWSRVWRFKKSWETEVKCHNSEEDLKAWMFNISQDFLNFRNSYIDFFDINKNSYALPKVIEVDPDYGNYLSINWSKNNECIFNTFDNTSWIRPSIKKSTTWWVNQLERSLFERYLGDFVNDSSNPLHPWLSEKNWAFSIYYPWYYTNTTYDSYLTQYYKWYDEWMTLSDIKSYRFAKQFILPKSYISWTLSKSEMQNKLDSMPIGQTRVSQTEIILSNNTTSKECINDSGSLDSSMGSNDLLNPQEGEKSAFFNDIDNSFAKDDILKLADSWIIKWYSDWTFRPDNSTTRAEFLAMAVKSLKIQLPTVSSTNFTDVYESWQIPYVEAAKNYNINWQTINWNLVFRPNDPISRAEALAMLFNLSQIKTDPSLTYSSFYDVRTLWMVQYVEKAKEMRIISWQIINKLPMFRPNDPISRAETVKFIINTLATK